LIFIIKNEGWAPATYITIHQHTYNLTCTFTNIAEPGLTHQVTARWTSPRVDTDKHTVGHETCNSRIFAIVFLGYLSNAFLKTILHYVPQSLRDDGIVILWTLGNNIYRNNVAFTKEIK
jgi:hypothetical protein